MSPQPRLFADYAATPTARERSEIRAHWDSLAPTLFDTEPAPAPASCPVCSSTEHTADACPHGTADPLPLDTAPKPQQTTTQENPRMSTYRERREARAERLRGWAEKREQRAAADLDRSDTMADAIPFGQPILTDHYSAGRDRNYRDRIHNTRRRGFESLDKARSMRSRADEIERQAAHAIYSDDHDAIDRLRERIAELEAARDRIKAYNATCRAGSTPDPSILDEKQRRDLATAQQYQPHACKGGRFPAYGLSNLTGNIGRQRKRLAQLEAQEAQR